MSAYSYLATTSSPSITYVVDETIFPSGISGGYIEFLYHPFKLYSISVGAHVLGGIMTGAYSSDLPSFEGLQNLTFFAIFTTPYIILVLLFTITSSS